MTAPVSAVDGLKTWSAVKQSMDQAEPVESREMRALRLLRIGTWSVLTLVVTALLTVTVVGPYLLGNPTVTGGQPVLFGGFLLALVVGTVGFVTVSVVLD